MTESGNNQAALAAARKLVEAASLLEPDEGLVVEDGRIYLWACQCGMTLCPRPDMKLTCCEIREGA